MSLFKIRTFWSTHCGDEESFDQNSLLITNLNNSDIIVTGSHNGILRIFQPSCELSDSNILVDYKVTDLLIETVLKEPILQVCSGRLVSGSPKTQIAVLQQRLLAVYTLITKEGATDHGVQHILQLLYEHKLKRLAYNCCVGPFGGTQNRDFICVQSLDGLLTFFEQESFSFCCFLPDFLLPGPLIFVRKTDSFITTNSNCQITSFRYKLLSEAGENSVEDDNIGKKINHDWKYNLGEAIIDLEVIEEPNSKEYSIIILGERNLFCLTEIGNLKFMKRLDFAPICFTNYFLNERVISLVVSETNNLMIYQNTSLKWSAQLQNCPIALKRAFMKNVSGVLVTLTDEGVLECSYLGTEPSLFVAPPLISQDLDFEKAGVELATLYKTIRSSYDVKVTNSSAERELGLNVSIELFEKCLITVDILPQGLFEEVQVAIFAHYPIKIEPCVAFFSNLSEKTSMECYAFVDIASEVVSLCVEVVASFISNLGVPRSVSRSVMLPLNFVLETCPPIKDSDCKITLNINQSPVALSQLFPEFETSGALAFRNVNSEVVTILLAKSSERYRLQSNSFASLSLLIEQMIYRLRKQFLNKSDFAIIFNPPLPTNELLKYVNKHFTSRKKYSALQEQLTQLTSQFRLIQKRLIAKFKVKNPTPLSNLELLLNDTFDEIMKVSSEIEEEAKMLKQTQIELSCALQVLVNLIKLMDCNNNAIDLVESTFTPFVSDLESQNWEDVIDASLCYLLRTALAKSEKDKLRAAHTSFEEVKDVAKIEKHLSQVLERIPKGVLLETHFCEDKQESDNEEDEVGVPIGSKIAESSTRLLSARKGLLSRRKLET